MIFEESKLKGAYLVGVQKYEDSRGFFGRWFCDVEFAKLGLETTFKQCNQSGTYEKGSIRGMHFQYPPHSEVKLVKCVQGEIFDVIVDIRADSPTFLGWEGFKLSSENKSALYIPKGFAHGFQTLTNYAEIIYMVSEPYNKNFEDGIRFNDPVIGIEWPLEVGIISDKDLNFKSIDQTAFTGVKI